MNAPLSFENSQNKKLPFEVYYYHAFLMLNVDSWPAPQTTVNLWLSPSTKQRRNPCSRSVPVYHDLSTRHDWTVKNAIVNLPIRLKGNSKRISGN